MRLNEFAMRHRSENNILSDVLALIMNEFDGNKDMLATLRNIEVAYYNDDDVMNRAVTAMDSISDKLPEVYTMYLLKHK
jgi:hypothetical protein